MKTCVRYVGGMTARKKPCGKPATKKITAERSSTYILMNAGRAMSKVVAALELKNKGGGRMYRNIHPTDVKECCSSRNSQLRRGRQLLEQLSGEEREILYRRVDVFDRNLLLRIENYCYAN